MDPIDADRLGRRFFRSLSNDFLSASERMRNLSLPAWLRPAKENQGCFLL
jgi:hypothetical protein